MKKKNRKIKIVLCANTSWYIYNFRKNTIIALIDHGCDVIVVAPYDDYVEDLIKLGARHFSFYLNGRSINLFKELFSLINLVFIYIYLRPHAVMNFTPKMNIYGTFASSIVRSKTLRSSFVRPSSGVRREDPPDISESVEPLGPAGQAEFVKLAGRFSS